MRAPGSHFRYAAAPMRVLILGGDGYLGWPTALRFSARGHEVAVVDNFSRRRWHEEAGTGSLTPIRDLDAAHRRLGGGLRRARSAAIVGSVAGRRLPRRASSPRSGPRRSSTTASRPPPPTRWPRASRRSRPSTRNVIGNLNLLFAIRDHVPDCHLVKLGTMGEYGQPNIDIEEGYIEIEHKGRTRHPAVPEAAGLALPLLEGPRLDQHPLRLPHLGPARHRPQPGRRLRDRDRGDGRRRAPDHPLRLRRGLRHRAQPLLPAGGDRPPADRLRRRQPDPRLPQHPRHARLRRAGGR